MAKELSAAPAPVGDPLFGAAWAAAGNPRPSRPWNLPLVNGIAVAAIIGAVAYRIWQAHLPPDVLREEAILIGIGVVFAAVALAVKVSRYRDSLAVQVPVMVVAAVLATLVLGVAGRWLGDDLLTVRYEDLVADPAAVVPEICRFLEIAYEPGMLAVEETPPDRIAAGQGAWFTELYAGITASSVGKWRRQMKPSDVALFESIAGAELERHGYETGSGGEPPRIPDAAWQAHNWSVKLWHFTVLHV